MHTASSLVRVFLLGTIYTVLGVANNVAFWKVGNAMPHYQTFLAYATCAFNPLVFLCVWCCKKYLCYDKNNNNHHGYNHNNNNSGGDDCCCFCCCFDRHQHRRNRLNKPLLSPIFERAEEEEAAVAAEEQRLLYPSSSSTSSSTSASISSSSSSSSSHNPFRDRIKKYYNNRRHTSSMRRQQQGICPTGRLHFLGMCYGAFTASNAITSMMSDSHLSGGLQNILNQMLLPIMAILSRVCLHHRMDGWEAAGSLIVMIGSIFGVISSLDDDGPDQPLSQQVFWVFIYIIAIASLPPQSILQQYVVKKYYVDPLPMIFVGSVYGLLFSLFAVFLDVIPPFIGPGDSLEQVFSTQAAAWRCGLGLVLDENCAEGAWQSYLVFGLTSGLMAWTQMVLINEESAMFFVVIDAVSVPATAIAFAIPLFLGSDVESLTWSTIVSVVIITSGVIVYKMKEIKEACGSR